MSMAEEFKYRAFLSYSHSDTGAAKRVHGRLEGFHIDKELIGRNTPTGPIPVTLRPIFRDRHEFDAGGSLAEQTTPALDGSAALIVLASPPAARSKNVNEEIRLFKSRHPERPVIPLIVDGEPGDPQNECFPPALRFIVAPDGAITDTPVDVLAADLREKGDGFELALAKVVARLIGLAPDDVYRRAERDRRRQGRLRIAVAAVIAVLAIVGGGLFWQSHQQKQTLNEIATLVDKYSLVTSAQAAVPGAKQSLTDAITAIAEGAATDPRYAQALALLKAGKPGEAEPLLKAVAEDKVKRSDTDAKDAAAAYRNLASIAFVSDPGRARGYYAEAARLDPSNLPGMFLNGWFQEQAGQLDAAKAAYIRVIAAAKPGADDQEVVLAKFGMGSIAQQRGDLSAALATYHEAETVADRMATSDPGNIQWQGDLSTSYQNMGDVQVAQGDLPAALTSYQAGLVIADRLAQSGDVLWQHDLAISYERIGDVQVAQGNLPAAMTSYQANFTIMDRLAKSDPGNTEWQLNLSESYDRAGDVQKSQGNLPAALSSYEASLVIRDRLAKSDPGNAGWQRDLPVSYNKVGDVQVAQGDLPAALTSYQAGLVIADRLAKSDPGNAGWQRDLSVSYDGVGDVQVAQGNLPEALTSDQAALAIRDRLAKSDPGNAQWQRDLSVSYNKIGDVQKSQGNLSAALASYQAGLAIRDRLAKSDPGNAQWQFDLGISNERIGDVQLAQGDLAGALKSYEVKRDIISRLAKSDPGNADWQRDLSVSYSHLAYAYLKSKQALQAQEALIAGRAILAPLTAQHPEFSQWKQELAWFDQKIAALKEQ